MSLTSQLARGDLGRWFARTMPGTTAVAAEVADAAARVRPVRPQAGAVLGDRHWADVGGAFGARLGALVQAAPPYYGLYGLVSPGLLTLGAAHEIAAGYPSHAGLTPVEQLRALDMRPAPTGWRDLGGPCPDPDPPAWGDAVFAELAARTRGYHDQHAPTGAVGAPGAEAGLARVYGLWSTCEDIYRSGVISEELEELLDLDRPTVAQLRAATPEAVVNELVGLTRRLAESGSLTTLRGWAGNPEPGQPLGCAGPVFATHWADGDLLVGDTLLDVKTVMRADHPDRTGRWLWQILAYAWLDTAGDRYRIRAAGLYLARHGVLLRWDVDELAARLLGDRRAVSTARREFLEIAARAATSEGARLDP